MLKSIPHLTLVKSGMIFIAP